MAKDKKARRFSHGVGGRTRSAGSLDRREKPLISSRCARSGQLSSSARRAPLSASSGSRWPNLIGLPCKYYNREAGNSPFLRTRTPAQQDGFLSQDPQNSVLRSVGEQSARTTVGAKSNEPTILRRDSGLRRVSKATRRLSKGLGNLGRAPC